LGVFMSAAATKHRIGGQEDHSASSQIALQTAAAATISGHLFRASITARQMALAAKNSRAMVLRAGSKAAGLKVISDYFDDLADKTISLSSTINQYAVAISQNSVRQWRTITFINRVRKGQDYLKKGQAAEAVIAQLDPSVETASAHHQELANRLDSQLKNLKDQLENIHHYMQSSNVVAVTFRLEATQTGEFQPLLEHMAATIDGLTNDIKGHINTSQNQLNVFNIN